MLGELLFNSVQGSESQVLTERWEFLIREPLQAVSFSWRFNFHHATNVTVRWSLFEPALEQKTPSYLAEGNYERALMSFNQAIPCCIRKNCELVCLSRVYESRLREKALESS